MATEAAENIAETLLKQAHPPDISSTIFREKVKQRPLLLRPSSPDPKRDARSKRQYERQRKANLARKSKKSKPLSAKQKRALCVYDIPKEQQKYAIYEPLLAMWCTYMRGVLGLSDGKRNYVDANGAGQMLVSADYHGALVEVVRSRCVDRVGLKGIVVKDTKFTYEIVTVKDELKTVPKEHTIFRFELPLAPKDGEAVQKPLSFEIHGSRFENRAPDRANKKFRAHFDPDLHCTASKTLLSIIITLLFSFLAHASPIALPPTTSSTHLVSLAPSNRTTNKNLNGYVTCYTTGGTTNIRLIQIALQQFCCEHESDVINAGERYIHTYQTDAGLLLIQIVVGKGRYVVPKPETCEHTFQLIISACNGGGIEAFSNDQNFVMTVLPSITDTSRTVNRAISADDAKSVQPGAEIACTPDGKPVEDSTLNPIIARFCARFAGKTQLPHDDSTSLSTTVKGGLVWLQITIATGKEVIDGKWCVAMFGIVRDTCKSSGYFSFDGDMAYTMEIAATYRAAAAISGTAALA